MSKNDPKLNLAGADELRKRRTEPSPTWRATAPAAAETPPVPEPTSYELKTRMLLVLGLVLAYLALLGFLAVMWLAFGHPNLETPVMGGFAFLGAAAATVFGHYLGAQATVSALQTGVGLMPDPRQTPRRE